jgi:hypothetical protein
MNYAIYLSHASKLEGDKDMMECSIRIQFNPMEKSCGKQSKVST